MAFPDGWGRRCELVTQHSQVEQDCTDFPMLVHEDSLPSEIFDADGSYSALNGGGDLRFSSDEAGDSQLPCEIESFITDNDPANGKSAVWVKRTLSSAANTSIWIYYNKAGESQPAEDNAYGKENVWDSGFVMVQHMNQTPTGSAGDIVDSTSNNNDGTTYGGMDSADQVAGQIDGSLDFDGGNVRVIFGGDAGIDMGTINSASIWVNFSSLSSTQIVIGHKSYLDGYLLSVDATKLYYIAGTGATYALVGVTHGLSTGQWANLAVSRSGTTVNFYKNGQQLGATQTLANSYIVTVSTIGAYYAGNSPTSGIIDEVRISNVARTARWIATEYNSQYSPITFLIPETPETPVAYSEQFKDLLSEISAGIEELFDLSVEITATCAPFPRYVDLFTQMAVGVISFPPVRREFTVMKRTTDFTIVPRATDFIIVPRTIDFTIVK